MLGGAVTTKSRMSLPVEFSYHGTLSSRKVNLIAPCRVWGRQTYLSLMYLGQSTRAKQLDFVIRQLINKTSWLFPRVTPDQMIVISPGNQFNKHKLAVLPEFLNCPPAY